jgi:hypothetical protein
MGEVETARKSLDARLADWEARLDRLETAIAQPPSASASEPETAEDGSDHLLFVPSPEGYKLVECVGRSPLLGELLDLDGHEEQYAVTRIVRSPLPGDGRPCAYLEAT